MKLYLPFVFLSLLVFISASAQDFKWEAKLPTIEQNGYYDILLTHNISGYANKNFSDLRLFDDKGNEVPYFLSKSVAKESAQQFQQYEIVEKKIIPSKSTKIVFKNSDKKNISNISLILKNSDVKKTATLSGSDDLKNWYGIKSDYFLESIFNEQNNSEVKIIDFPITDYLYYKLDISDSNSAPLNILKIGYYNSFTEKPKFIELPSPSIKQVDSSNHNSYIDFSFPYPLEVDQLQFVVAGPKYFLRSADLGSIVQNKKKKYFQSLYQLDIKSNSENKIFFNDFSIKKLTLVINNKNDLPLNIKNIKAFQLMHVITCDLTKGHNYFLRYGNKDLSYPQYDLEFFRDSIPDKISTLQIKDVKQILKSNKTEVKKESFFKSKAWIWLAIGIIAALLAFMSWKMLKDLKKD